MQQHPLSALFPHMPEIEKKELIEDILANGIQHPIVLFEGMVLDGWHRYSAAEFLGIDEDDIPVIHFDGDDPVGYVLSMNIHRRMLSPSERARVVVECRSWRSPGVTSAQEEAALTKTNEELAAEAHVSESTIARVKREAREEKGEDTPPHGKSPKSDIIEEPEEGTSLDMMVLRKRVAQLESELEQECETTRFLRDQLEVEPAVQEQTLNNQRAEISALRASNTELATKLQEKTRECTALKAEVTRLQGKLSGAGIATA